MLDILLKALLVIAGAALVTIAVSSIINKNVVQTKIKEECANAFKALIREKKKNAIKVGIFDSSDTEIKDMEITSKQGVSNDLYVGQVIYC